VGIEEEEEEEAIPEDAGDAKFPYRKLVQRKDSMRGRGRLHDKRSRSLVTLGSAIHRRQHQHQHQHGHGRAGSSHSQDEDVMKSLSVEYNIRYASQPTPRRCLLAKADGHCGHARFRSVGGGVHTHPHTHTH
jgi:hypothetical protein